MVKLQPGAIVIGFFLDGEKRTDANGSWCHAYQ